MAFDYIFDFLALCWDNKVWTAIALSLSYWTAVLFSLKLGIRGEMLDSIRRDFEREFIPLSELILLLLLPVIPISILFTIGLFIECIFTLLGKIKIPTKAIKIFR